MNDNSRWITSIFSVDGRSVHSQCFDTRPEAEAYAKEQLDDNYTYYISRIVSHVEKTVYFVESKYDDTKMPNGSIFDR